MRKGFYMEDDRVKKREKRNACEEGLERVMYAIDSAKKERANMKKARIAAAAKLAAIIFLCIIIAIPNMSPEAAQAMSEIPVIGTFFKAITFKDYYYYSDRFRAEVHVPEIILDDESKNYDGAESINIKVNAIAQRLVEEFENSLKDDAGYSELYVNYEVVCTTDDYFTLKLITYQGAGSGYEKNYYYTIDLNTGKELRLEDIFPEGSDYINPISENIKEQMRQGMAEDDEEIYWVDLSEDDPVNVWEFDKITDEQQFYIDGDGNLVIAFNEGDVAPMYMGCIEFTIPKEITENIR